MTFKVFTLSLSLFISTGCATLTSGTRDKIRLETTPSGAKVTDESGVLLTTTPGSITIKRKKTPKLTFSKEGYEDVNVQLTRKTNKKSLLNLVWVALGVNHPGDGMDGMSGILFGSTYSGVSYAIDLLSGAIWDHDESIRLEMIKTETD